MAGLLFTANLAETTSGTAAKTWFFIEAPTNQKVKLLRVNAWLLGTVAADPPAKYEFLFGTKGSGTSSGSITCLKLNPLDTETIQTVVRYGYGGANEPTYTGGTNGLRLASGRHPQSAFEYVAPLFDGEIVIPGGYALGIRLTTTAGYNFNLSALLEE